MKISRIFSLCTLVAALALSALGQGGRAVNGVPGFLNPRTGAFTPMQVPVSDDVPPPVTTVTGKFVVAFTINVASTIPSTDVISCGVESLLLDSGASEFLEDAAVAATRTGSTATCTVTIPYSWSLATPTTDMVTLTFTIDAPATKLAFPSRLSTHTFATIKVPANGATTNFTLTPTI